MSRVGRGGKEEQSGGGAPPWSWSLEEGEGKAPGEVPRGAGAEEEAHSGGEAHLGGRRGGGAAAVDDGVVREPGPQAQPRLPPQPGPEPREGLHPSPVREA